MWRKNYISSLMLPYTSRTLRSKPMVADKIIQIYVETTEFLGFVLSVQMTEYAKSLPVLGKSNNLNLKMRKNNETIRYM